MTIGIQDTDLLISRLSNDYHAHVNRLCDRLYQWDDCNRQSHRAYTEMLNNRDWHYHADRLGPDYGGLALMFSNNRQQAEDAYVRSHRLLHEITQNIFCLEELLNSFAAIGRHLAPGRDWDWDYTMQQRTVNEHTLKQVWDGANKHSMQQDYQQWLGTLSDAKRQYKEIV